MTDKLQTTREYIIREIENGKLKAGDKLPGAREMSEDIGISLAIVQMAFVSLVRDGILVSIPRRGTFVHENWNKRILPGSFVLFRSTWSEIITNFLQNKLPAINIRSEFTEGMFEIRSTLHVQQHRYEYLDLAELLDEVYPDSSIFFSAPFHGFRTPDNRLFGLPLMYSPRVVCYNPEMLARAGCEPPCSNWNWDDFISLVRQLRKYYAKDQVINWVPDPFYWINFVFRAGGSIIDCRNQSCEVAINSPQTKLGLSKVLELKEILGIQGREKLNQDYLDDFNTGKLAMAFCARQQVDFNSPVPWKNIPLPSIPGGTDITAQATELLCVRKQSGDLELVREVIRLLLSREVQDHIGALRYGIPIRKTSAIHSFGDEDPRDQLFLAEMPKISAGYNIDSPEVDTLIQNAMEEVWFHGANLDQTMDELAAALKTMFRYKVLKTMKNAS